MRKLLYVGIIILLAFGGIKLGSVYGKKEAPITLTPQRSVTNNPSPTPALPKRLRIPKLSVDTAIESVGMDRDGRMDVPSVVTDTAWYNLGPRPGSQGNAVIDGHFDTVTGAPSVFYNLKTLAPGDTITVTDAKNASYTFKVAKVTAYPTDQFPLQLVFGDNTDKSKLNLITCGGTWDKAAHNYLERTVVFATLEK